MKPIKNSDYLRENIPGHYFLEATIENVRCFGRKSTLKLSDAHGLPHHWTVILGDNGAGKTTLLRSLISLAPSPKIVRDDSQNIRLYPGFFDWRERWDPRRHAGEEPSIIRGTIVAADGFKKLRKDSTQQLELRHGHKAFDDIVHSSHEYEMLGDFLCFAYGASRKMGFSSLANEKFSTASISLFDDEAPLINVEEFFLQADYEAKSTKSAGAAKQRDEVKKLILRVLPDVNDLRIVKSERAHGATRQVEMKTPYGWVRMRELSLGYKSLIAWIVDFASRMYYYHRLRSNPFAQPAVVLIDEIDLHLHPRWQRKILGHLSRVFPNTQFIVTAHSPLIVQTAMDWNLVLLKRQGDRVIINNDPEAIASWRIDQILTSDLFGLPSARSEKSEKIMQERRRLLAKETLNAKERSRLEKLDLLIGLLPVDQTPEYLAAKEILKKAKAAKR
ncbi:MAG: AAA family ATPase [Bacteroidia bacterium]|nr:AAA family ATPase [Bacteroidia bacterium]